MSSIADRVLRRGVIPASPGARFGMPRVATNAARRSLATPSPWALFHASSAARKPNPNDASAGAAGGSYARTDGSITREHLPEGSLISSTPVAGAGRAGANVLPTLATFSLEGKVGVVTGGARGLGLVMGQGMVISGADLAIVDMNRPFPRFRPVIFIRGGGQKVLTLSVVSVKEATNSARSIVEAFKKENPSAKR